MKLRLLVMVLALSVGAFAQHGGHGGGMGGGGGMGNAGGTGNAGGMSGGNPGMSGDRGSMGNGSMGADHGQTQGQQGGMSQTQQPLRSAQLNGGAWNMLQQKTGMTSTQLQQLYQTSGAKNFGQFVSAIVVSKNLGLDYNQVLAGMKTESLGKTLQSLGVSKSKANDAVKQAKQEIKHANSNKS
jgi:hypothetical protein